MRATEAAIRIKNLHSNTLSTRYTRYTSLFRLSIAAAMEVQTTPSLFGILARLGKRAQVSLARPAGGSGGVI